MGDIQEAARILRAGGVCVIPTETSYGLAASIVENQALERIYRIKRRPLDKPLLILIDSISQAPVDHASISPCARQLMEAFWPGPLTLLLPAKQGLPFALTGGTGRIGVRVSSHPVAASLVQAVGVPITATSANISGKGLPKSIGEVKVQFRQEQPDFFLDIGKISPGPASTIIDVTVEPPRIVRVGAINLEDIRALCEITPFGDCF